MREIKFRGMRLDNGEWVIGNLITDVTAVYLEAVRTFINNRISTTEFNGNSLGGIVTLVEVDPATVGQYTGLKDKNGVELFEGDVVLITYGDVVLITYGRWREKKQGLTRIGKVIFSKDAKFCVKINNSAVEVGFYDSRKSDIEVIGNIHQHPELLEVSK